MGRYHRTEEILEIMKDPRRLRNIALVGHIDHGKTTLSDSLLAEAGLLSEQLAGEARALDYLEEEQKRGITMKAANVSLYYDGLREEEADGKVIEGPVVINLVDTPGHLDFSGKVTRALRLVDGAIIIVDVVEEINAQSETVIRQALNEAVKPILFINKIDRLFNELKLELDEIREKIDRIIITFNALIEQYAGARVREVWGVSPDNGSVIFGSALHRWGFTVPQARKEGWNFSKLYDVYREGKHEILKNIFPVWEAVLRAVVKHLPPPNVAQRYRIRKIWHGDPESDVGKAMINCDPKGPLVVCLSNIKYDTHGLIATGRIFSGTLRRGQTVYLVDAGKKERILKVALYMGARLDNVSALPCGNIAAIGGLKYVRSGETIVDYNYRNQMVSFEKVRYVSEPVVTVAIEPEMLKDLDNLKEKLEHLMIEDPNLVYNISNDTGEILLSGMGPLHLEIAGNELKKKGVNITMSKPMSVFRESIAGESPPITVKSPDGTGEITVRVRRTGKKAVKFLSTFKPEIYRDFKEIKKLLAENTDLSPEEIEGYFYSDSFGNIAVSTVPNLRIERYRGRKAHKMMMKEKRSAKGKKIGERTVSIKESTVKNIIYALRSILRSGPCCRERLGELTVIIEHVKLPEKAEEEGAAEITAMLREAIFKALDEAGTVILEPIYKLIIRAPPHQIGTITNLLNQHRAKIIDIKQDKYQAEITARISVRHYINFVEEIRSATSGRAFWQTQFESFEEIPASDAESIIHDIKFRKGMMFL